MTHKLLLVEDDQTLGEVLQERLQKEGYIVDWVRTAKDAIKSMVSFDGSLVLFDVGLPDGDGFTLAEKWKKEKKGMKFLFLSAHSGPTERMRGYDLGAVEFIPKPFHLRELLVRLEHILGTVPTKQKIIYRYEEFEIDPSQFQISKKNEIHSLSLRDMSLLVFLIQNQDRVLSRNEILDQIWGEDQFPTQRTIDNSIVRIRGILGDDCIQSVRGVGYHWVGVLS
jgi:DNA-binding response OmpR family regulator